VADQASAGPGGASPLAPGWLELPADLNELVPALWAHDVARTAGGELAVGGLPVSEIKAAHGSPVFVLSEPDFRARARAFKTAFDAAFDDVCGGVDVYYAGKSFLCTAVAAWVREEGLRLDTASGGELAVAARAGTPGGLIGLHGNNKSDAEIRRALEMGVGRIIVDSLAELERVAAIAAARGTDAPGAEAPRARVMLRLTPGVHAHTHEFIATAHEDQKFGLSMAPGTASAGFAGAGNGGAGGADSPASMAEEAVAAAAAHDSIELLGVHCHIGSQIFEPEGFEAAAVKLLEFVADMRSAYGVQLPELDLGGGYGIAYVPGDTPRPPAEIAQALAGVVRATCARLGITAPRISIEPGRAIVGPTTFTLYEAGTVKDVVVDVPEAAAPEEGRTAVRRYVSVDGGMSDNARPVLYDADYSAVLANRTSDAPAQLARVVGKHCESGDIVVRDVYLPADVRAGDLIAVPGTGAYCWALSSNYNYLARPGVLAVRDGTARWIVRGETEDDLLSRDMGV
jgi:diaminopimelate decarboxylase